MISTCYWSQHMFYCNKMTIHAFLLWHCWFWQPYTKINAFSQIFNYMYYMLQTVSFYNLIRLWFLCLNRNTRTLEISLSSISLHCLSISFISLNSTLCSIKSLFYIHNNLNAVKLKNNGHCKKKSTIPTANH